MESGTDSESEPSPTRLEWDGTQFLPPKANPDNSAHSAEYAASLRGIGPDEAFPILAWLIGSLVLGFSLLALLLSPRDLTWEGIAATTAAVGAGLIVWGRLEQIRIRPLQERLRAQSLAERLSNTLRFTSAELELNRRGHLSTAQRLRMLGVDVGWWLTVVTCFAVAGAGFASGGGHDPIKDIRALLFVVLGAYCIWVAGSTLIDTTWGRVRTDLTSLQVVVQPDNWVTDLVKRWYDSTAHYAYEGQDGLRFGVSRAAFEALTPGMQYRVYFAPVSKRLMSIEAADDQLT